MKSPTDKPRCKLNTNDQLFSGSKASAARKRISLTRLIEEDLMPRCSASTTLPRSTTSRLPVFNGRGGLVAGVDGLSNKALLESLGRDA